MTSMYKRYMELLQEETLKSTQSMENWEKFLDGASRNYKYNFSQQLLINNQKPNATAIADYDTWRGKTLNRVVKKGTAMYLPVSENGKFTVKNYFDVADTIATENSLPLPHWGFSSEHEKAVSEHIASQYGISDKIESDSDLGYVIDTAYHNVSTSYMDRNRETINRALEGSSLFSDIADLDDKYMREQAFESAVYASMALIINKRLGIRAELNEAFTSLIEPHLHLFNTEESINVLGNAVSSLSEEYLRSIETAVKTLDREQQEQKTQKEREQNEQRVHPGSNERNGLLRAADGAGIGGNDRVDEGGRYDTQQVGIQRPLVHDGLDGRERPRNDVPVSQHSDGRTTLTAETVGNGEDGLLDGIQQLPSGTDGNNRPAQTLSGDTGTSGSTEEEHDGGNPQRPGEQSNREGQGTGPDGLGGQNEQLPSQGTRNNLQRPDLQLSLEQLENETQVEKAPTEGAFSMEQNPVTETPLADESLDTADNSTDYDTTSLLAVYAKISEAAAPQRVGSNVLMPPLFHDMNFNRTGRRIRVTVEEPAGKYQLFSREENGNKNLYFLTASGMITRTSDYFPNEWDEEQNKWVNVRPTEAQLDEVLPQISAQFEQDMATPTMWAKYQHAAVVNRIDDCEAHNVPVREMRDTEREQRRLAAEQEKLEQEKRFIEKYDAKIDAIAKAIEKGEDISVRYDEYAFGGKNPVLDLFRLYDVELPLRTQGWVNTGLASIKGDSYRYYKSKKQRDSSVFMKHLQTLKRAIEETPIEQKRGYTAVDTEVEVAAETVPEAAPENEAADNRLVENIEDVLGAFSAQKIPPMFVVDWEDTQHDFDLNLYEDGDMVAYDKDGVSFKVTKMDGLTFISSTTSINPIGDILGDKDIPSYIRQQMKEYRNGDITAEQVREQTLERLVSYKNQEPVTEAEYKIGDIFTQHMDTVPFTSLQIISVDGDYLMVNYADQPSSSPFPIRIESFEKALADGSTVINAHSIPLELEQSIADYPQSIAHSPLLKRWYDAFEQNEELTLALAKKCNEESFFPMTSARPRRQTQPFFERVSAPVLMQSQLTDAAFEILHNELGNGTIKKQISLGFGSLGNGLTAWNRLYENPDTEDFDTVAHIDSDRNITWYSDDLPEDIKAQITDTAETTTDNYFIDLAIHNERKEWLSMINEMVSTNRFITKEDFSFTPFDKHGGLAKFVELYGIDGYERVLNRINREAMPQGLDNVHDIFKKQYPDRVIAVAAQAGFIDVRNIPASTGLSISVKDGFFRRRVSGSEYGDLLKRLRVKGVAVVSVYPESGEIFAHKPGEAVAREVEQTLTPLGNKTDELPLLPPFRSENEQIKAEHGNAVVIWNNDNIYETYGEDAKTAASTLGIPMTERFADVPTPYLVTGIPIDGFDEYRNKLVLAGYAVAVAHVEGNEYRLESVTTPETVKASEIAGNDKPLQSNEHTENLDGVDFVFTEVRGEQERLEISQDNEPLTWYSADKNIPYKQGDIVRTRNISIEILQLNHDGVHYRFVEDNTAFATPIDPSEIKNMPRSQFESNLDSGKYQSITSGDNEIYVGADTLSSDELNRSSLDRFTKTKEKYPNHIVITKTGEFAMFHGEDAKHMALNFDFGVSTINVDRVLVTRAGYPDDKIDGIIERLNASGRDVVYVNSYGAMAEYKADGSQLLNQDKNAQIKTTPELPQAPVYQGTPMWQDYQALSDQHSGQVLFYRLGDFYEVLGDNAPAVAEALNIALTGRDVGLTERVPMLGVPQHTLESYLQILNEKGFNVAVRHGQDDIELFLTEDESFDWDKTVQEIAKDTASYTEPFVVIEFMEGGPDRAFNRMDRLTFREADIKFKAVEAAFRAETENEGYYDKTFGAVFYKENPDDTELSVYGFRYDVGDYDEERSGLYNHIANYWGYLEEGKAAKPDVYSYVSDEDIASTKKMLSVLAEYVDVVPVYKPQIPNRTPQIGDEVYHGGVLHRLDGIDGIMIKLFNLETNNVAAMITTKERFFEGLQEDERNRHLFYETVQKSEERADISADLQETEQTWQYNSNTVAPEVAELTALKADPHEAGKLQSDYNKLRTSQDKFTYNNPVLLYRYGNAYIAMEDMASLASRELGVETSILSTHQTWAGEQNLWTWAFSADQLEHNLERMANVGLTPIIAELDAENRRLLKAFPLNLQADQSTNILQEYQTWVNDFGGKLETSDISAVEQNMQSPDSWYRVGDTVYFNDAKHEITDISDEGIIATRDAKGELRYDSPEMFDAMMFTNDRNQQLRSERNSTMPKTKVQEPLAPKPKNFRMDSINYADISEGGPKAKYKRNIEAIRTLQAIEDEGRTATADEQAILAKYVGWGGVSEVFSNNNYQWREEYKELQKLLAPDEYDAAKASVLTAYYTEPIIMKAMWDKVEQLGDFSNYGDNIKSVNVLEPSMGVGNFYGTIPEHLNNNANMQGVELDSISGRIARLLYPDSKIQIKGFEKTAFKDDFFDIAIGNVPFSEAIKPVDWMYDKEKFLVHDYFFNKALDKVRPGGVVAFITSAGTLDKVDDKARMMMAEKADLLGAIRLPNNAFKANAGTEVVSDIIFLQKREEPLDGSIHAMPEWVGTREKNGVTEQRLNNYFVNNPHMIVGKYEKVSSQFGQKETVQPIAGADLGEQLQEAMKYIVGSIPVREIPEIEVEEDVSTKHIAYDDIRDGFFDSEGKHIDVKDNSYVIVDGEVYFRNNRKLGLVEEKESTMERIKGMVSLRGVLRDLIQAQVDDRPNVEIERLQAELNTIYDKFTAEHGLITLKDNEKAFDNDDSYFLLASLEELNDELEFTGKSDIFTKRTIRPHIEITSASSSSQALGVSIGKYGKVDLDYMAELTGFDKERIINDLKGVIFLDTFVDSSDGDIYDVSTVRYSPADEYLSGNIRKKLELARELAKNDPRYEINVAALEKAQPKDLEAHEIYVRIGTTWIDKKYVQQFMYEILETPNLYKAIHQEGDAPSRHSSNKWDERNRITVQYSPMSNEWRITNKNAISERNIKADIEFGTETINAYHILEQTLNLKDIVIKKTVRGPDGKDIEIVDEEATMLARQKQEDLKTAFRDWVFKDPERREALVATFNEKFNSTRPREYDGKHITFAGMNAEITLDEHQINAVARGIYGGNALLAHEPGAGKSFAMAAIAMEGKRIGICSKSLITVPKHLTGQMASEFLRLYPNANILVATDRTFEPKNRKKFCSKIATGNYDAVILGHTQFGKIQLSKENQLKYYEEQFNLLVDAIAEAKEADGGYFTVKQMEKVKSKVKDKLDELYKDKGKDTVITFEELGADKLFVDEADLFKNLHLYTKMQNVAGISQTEAQKSADLFMKCRYLDNETGSKGTVFSTGTPISNSLTELYTMMRYLQFEKLYDLGLENFDQWASIFTEPTTELELAPEGTGYRMRTRCARFQNLPELMKIFSEVADIKTAETLNLPRPDADFQTISCEPTEIQREMVQALGERADSVRRRSVKPHEDNMLAVTNDGRKLGLDQRVINPNLPDDPNSKINQATNNIFDIWEETKEDSLTQVVFCDLATPKKSIWGLDKEQQKEVKELPLIGKVAFIGKHVLNTAKNYIKGVRPQQFNIYDDVKAKLILKGIPEDEIAFVQDCKTDKQKQQLFAKVRAGTIRVVFGSTETMGAGTNIQNKLIALHHLDCPWRPRDLEQREKRIQRRGNENTLVRIFKYVTKDTFDAYLWQTIEKKQQFISQIMTEKSPVRTVDDVDQSVLDFAEVKALCVGNPKIREKMDLEHDLKTLNALQGQYKKNLYSMESALLKKYPKDIATKTQNIENYTADKQRVEAETVIVSEGISPMVIYGIQYNERAKAGEAIKEACQNITTTEGEKIGTYRGFDLHLAFSTKIYQHYLVAKGDMSYPVYLDGDFSAEGAVTRLENTLDKIPQYIEEEKDSLQNTINEIKNAEVEVKKPFAQEAELKEKTARVAALNIELTLDAQKLQKEPTETVADKFYIEDYGYGLTVSEKFAAFADRFVDDTSYDNKDSQENSESTEAIVENFEVAENGGQGAFISGDIHVEKSTENVSAVPDSIQQVQKAAPNNVHIVGTKPLTADEKANTPNTQPQQQATQKPVKPKRNYHVR